MIARSSLTCHIQGSTRNERFTREIDFSLQANSLSTDLVKTSSLVFLCWYLVCRQMSPVTYQGETIKIPKLRQDLTCLSDQIASSRVTTKYVSLIDY